MPAENKPVILVTGACGQIGTELTKALRQQYGSGQVIATDLQYTNDTLKAEGPYRRLDVLDKYEIEKIVAEFKVTQIYHLVAMLSATGERNPMPGWDLNMVSLLNVLETARTYQLAKVFWPSSIAIFGPSAFKRRTPQNSFTDPSTVYGISKSAGEQWCTYYRDHYGLDVRSLRYPGLIGHSAPPGGGTTDYAVAIFHEALREGKYTSYLNPDTRLPMMYMADAVRATLELMTADRAQLTVRGAYNIAGLSFTPAELADELRSYLPEFEMHYAPDQRQQIAASWPVSIDDEPAQKDWGWQPRYDLVSLTADMLQHLQPKYQPTQQERSAV